MAVDRSINVLIVDDYESMLETLQGLLVRLDFKNIDQARSGAEALEKLRAGTFGLVISDWNMEPMDGIALYKEIRADERLKRLPFVMATAETEWAKLSRAEDAGIEHFLTKPISLDGLKRELTGVLGPL